MGRRGPAPEPRTLRVLKGTNHGRLPEHNPHPRALQPDPTDWLGPAARAECDELTEEMRHVPGWLTRVDKSVLAWRCHWYARSVELAKDIADNGDDYEALSIHPDDRAHGGERAEVLATNRGARPQIKMLNDAWTHLARCDQELGLTPASRTRVQARPFATDPADERGLDAM